MASSPVWPFSTRRWTKQASGETFRPNSLARPRGLCLGCGVALLVLCSVASAEAAAKSTESETGLQRLVACEQAKPSAGKPTVRSAQEPAPTSPATNINLIQNSVKHAMNAGEEKQVLIEVEQYQYNELGPARLISTESFKVSEGEAFGDLHIKLPFQQLSGPIFKLTQIRGAEHATVTLTQNLTASAKPSPKDMTYTVTLQKSCHHVGPIDGGGNICLRIVR